MPNYTGDMIQVNLSDASHPSYYGKILIIKCVIAGKDLAPYVMPKEFVFSCANAEGEPIKKCALCRAYNNCANKNDNTPAMLHANIMINKQDIDFEKDGALIADMIGVQKDRVIRILEERFSPVKCKHLELMVLSTQNVEDVNLIPEINFEYKDNEYVVRQAYVLGLNISTNSIYNMKGILIPSPKNQQAIHMISKAEQTKDNISEFELTDDVMDSLSIFRDNGNIPDKIRDIYQDFTSNVTKIYKREDVLMALDLVYHSALHFKLLGDFVAKGWLECLIIGDTRTGKSKTAELLMRHYKMGEIVAGENTSLAGLLAGLQNTNKRWTLMWGKIPLNDRRLLVIDEASGLTDEDFSKLSSVRSSGIAEITKIQMLKTFARTRLVWISNPRSRKINEYSYGVLAVKELFGKQEDIARLDYAVAVSIEDVPQDMINMRHDDRISHKYTSDLCNLLIRFAWSRKEEDINISKETEDEILVQAKRLSETYSSMIPLVTSAEIRIKIAKMAVALAIRLFNVNKETKKVDVTCDHVRYVAGFIDYIYTKDAMGYKIYSEQRENEQTIHNEGVIKSFVIEPDHFNLLLDNSRFTQADFMDIFECEKAEAKKIMTQMIKARALKKISSFYVKTPAFINWLKTNKDKTPEASQGKFDL